MRASFLFAGIQNRRKQNFSPGAITVKLGPQTQTQQWRPTGTRPSAPRHRWPQESTLSHLTEEQTGKRERALVAAEKGFAGRLARVRHAGGGCPEGLGSLLCYNFCGSQAAGLARHWKGAKCLTTSPLALNALTLFFSGSFPKRIFRPILSLFFLH